MSDQSQIEEVIDDASSVDVLSDSVGDDSKRDGQGEEKGVVSGNTSTLKLLQSLTQGGGGGGGGRVGKRKTTEDPSSPEIKDSTCCDDSIEFSQSGAEDSVAFADEENPEDVELEDVVIGGGQGIDIDDADHDVDIVDDVVEQEC